MHELIVVASHGTDYIDACLDSLDTYASEAHVAVVSSDDAGNVWPTGKLYWAMQQYPDFDRFLLMQDSMTCLMDPLPWFREQWPETGGAVAWQRFPMLWDTDDQRRSVEEAYTSRPAYGICGPVFYTDCASLQLLCDLQLLPPVPTNRLESCATERAWAYAFEQAGLPVIGPHWDPVQQQQPEGVPPFRKTWANR